MPTAPPALTKEDALALLAESGYQVQPVDTPVPSTPGTPAPDNNRGRITGHRIRREGDACATAGHESLHHDRHRGLGVRNRQALAVHPRALGP